MELYAKITIKQNRKPDCKQIECVIREPIQESCCHAFFMLDMDNFKALNDTLGHMYGDQALYRAKTRQKGIFYISDSKG